MQILEISALSENKDIINMIDYFLEKHDWAQKLFSIPIIKISLLPVQLTDCLNRIFYETSFLNIKSTVYLTEGFDFGFSISTSEALNLIEMLTPPLLRKKYPNELTSLDNIISLLKTFLKEDLSDTPFYHSTFYKMMRLQHLDIDWSYDDNLIHKINLLEKNKTDHLPTCYIVHATKSFQEIMNLKDNDYFDMVAIAHLTSEDDLYEFIKAMDSAFNNKFMMSIVNIKTPKPMEGIYIEMTAHHMSVNENIYKWLMGSYKTLKTEIK